MEYNSVAVPWALNVNKRSVREMVSYYETEMSPFWWFSWWRHQRETFSALQAFCAGKSPVTGEFPVQRPVTRSFGAFFYLCLNKWLSKQWGRRWFETASRSLWRHCNVFHWLHRKLSKWHFRFNMDWRHYIANRKWSVKANSLTDTLELKSSAVITRPNTPWYYMKSSRY